MKIESLSPKFQKALQRCLDQLTTSLRDNLYSVVLYGSAARGGISKSSSDLNLLLVLHDSNPEAHRVIAGALGGAVAIRPMVICKNEMARSYRAFAIKFESIRRNYILLHGQDPFAQISPDTQLLRFLTEQALRDIRLRCIYLYVTGQNHRERYLNYLVHIIPRLFTDLGTALRIEGIEVPSDFNDRLAVFKKAWGQEAGILGDLLKLKQNVQDLMKLKQRRSRLTKQEMFSYHSRLFRLMDKVVQWMTH